ncbi:MAG: T9SS type A sorting domain-containing protein [Bacteroidetes bacterium]|nr:T9SS type A sorting domain-containing protein [Bacteroidota bacterium]
MKKTVLAAAVLALLGTSAVAQSNLGLATPTKATLNKVKPANPAPAIKRTSQKRTCGTPVPSKEWNEAFNKMVAQHKADMLMSRTTATSYTIPIIFHIINEGEAVGVGHNLSQAQVNSQITVLNQDYQGVGYNYTLYAGMTSGGQPAFYQFAHAGGTNAVEAASLASNGSIAIANCGIYFCLAGKDPSGATLAEPGIDRQPYTVGGNTTKPSASSNVQGLMDGTIKPATIWDPTKYFNVWVSDGGSSGLLGYATFPPAATSGTGAVISSQDGGTSNGDFGENVSNVTSTDGVWVSYTSLGNTGNVAAPYQYGRTLTHESGHYFGLRHIWGDGNCLDDYCNDTPPAAQANYVDISTTSYPYNVGTCTGNSPSNSTNGEMFMDFMDYSNDDALWMFTTDQKNRMLASLASSPYRSGPAANAANVCSGVTASTPTAAFSYPSTICANQATAFTDHSQGGPASWAWSTAPATSTITTASTQNPSIKFPSAGTYTVSLTVTNSAGNSSISHVVTVGSCTSSAGCDTLSNINPADTLTYYTVNHGYLSGSGVITTTTSTTYTNKMIGEVYKSSSFPVNITQVKGVMLICYRESANNVGTKGTSNLTVSMTNTGTDAGSNTIPGTTVLGSAPVSLSSIVAAPNVAGVDYAGNNVYNFNGYMKAYPVMFPTPITMPTKFGLTVSLPTNGDTLAIWSNSEYTSNSPAVGTGCVQLKPSTGALTWYNVQTAFNIPISFGIVPIACSASTGIEHNELGNNINLFPNPNSGVFSIAVTLPEATNLNLIIINTLGQTVYTRSENNISNAVLNCDLSSLARGVYYANITDGNGTRTVKKIVIE